MPLGTANYCWTASTGPYNKPRHDTGGTETQHRPLHWNTTTLDGTGGHTVKYESKEREETHMTYKEHREGQKMSHRI